MKRETFYITTPIYYVNDRPHIGHAYTTILADVLARYHRLLAVPTFFLTGTDEHGQKVQQAADRAGISPQEQADRTVVNFLDLWKKLETTHDDFIRTTEARHTAVVQEILQDLYDREEIYRAEYDGWYDVASETFVTEKDLPAGANPEDLPHIVRIRESNYFFRMGKYRDWLLRHIEEHPEFIQPEFRRNETLGFLRQPLNDLCISRPKSRMSWGIELPFDPDFVCYVWFDALVNYISAPGYRRDEKRFSTWWPADMHLIGKDILTTHTVYWPTMLKAMGLPMPRTIFAHGWWLSGDAKMSKSLGNVVNPMDMIGRVGVDPFRYFLIAEMALGQDASFTEEAFIKRYNSDLANDLGNLLSRLLRMMGSACDGAVPAPPAAELEGDEERTLWAVVQRAVSEMEASIDGMRLDRGLAEVMNAVRATNRYLEQKQPWTLAKDPGKRAETAAVLYRAADALRVSAGLLYPVMPGKMLELRAALGLGGAPEVAGLREPNGLPGGARIPKPKALFPRLEPAGEPKAGAPPPAAKKKKEKPMDAPQHDGQVSYDEFSRLDLRTAEVLKAERIEGTDKLMRLQLKVGEEDRQIVAGIAQHYGADELVGKTIVIVANLKPAKIRGVESRGMLLAAGDGTALKLVTPDAPLPSGLPVK
jgi:methionyl-tRNA synthetase